MMCAGELSMVLIGIHHIERKEKWDSTITE